MAISSTSFDQVAALSQLVKKATSCMNYSQELFNHYRMHTPELKRCRAELKRLRNEIKVQVEMFKNQPAISHHELLDDPDDKHKK